MVEGGVGLLRTLPPADERTSPGCGGRPCAGGRLARGAATRVRPLARPGLARRGALLVQAARVLRGAGTPGSTGTCPRSTGTRRWPPYAHVTAPLRRLCDRATNEVVLALVGGRAVPEWAVAEIEALPEVMAEATARARLRARRPRPGRGAGAAGGRGRPVPGPGGRRRRRARRRCSSRPGGRRPCPARWRLPAGRRGRRGRAGRRPGGPPDRPRGGRGWLTSRRGFVRGAAGRSWAAPAC